MLLKIFDDYKSLFGVNTNRPSLGSMLKIVEEKAYGNFKNKFHPLDVPKAKRSCFLSFLKAFYEKGEISALEYISSYMLVYLKLLAKYFYFFIFGKLKIVEIEKQDIVTECLQFSNGKQSIQNIYFVERITDLKSRERKGALSFKERFEIIKLSLRYLSLDIWHQAQYLVIRNSIRNCNLNFKEFIVEEGRDYTTFCVLNSIQGSFKSCLTIRAPYFYNKIPAYPFSYDRIITNNIFSLRKARLLIPKTEILHTFPQVELNRKITSKAGKLGFFPDIGGYLITNDEKDRMDKAIGELSKELNFPVYLTLHPQVKSSVKMKEYEKLFRENMLRVRENESVQEFIDDCSVLIGWWSTLVFQAFCRRKPVVLLDFLQDKQAYELVKASEGTIVYANSEKDLLQQVENFKNLELDELNRRFDKAFENYFKFT